MEKYIDKPDDEPPGAGFKSLFLLKRIVYRKYSNLLLNYNQKRLFYHIQR